MLHSDFHVGKTFKCGSRTWLCTDKGTRTVVAICIGPASRCNDWFRGLPEEAQEAYWQRPEAAPDQLDPSWFKGPPYAVIEEVFDENDIKGCEP